MDNLLLERILSARELTNNICSRLLPEDTVCQTIEDVSPPKWHLGHTTWYFEMFFLNNFVQGYQLFDKDFPYLFNSYYNSLGTRIDKHLRGTINRPTLDIVMRYRFYVDEQLRFLAKQSDWLAEIEPSRRKEALLLLELGLHHEQQHQELLIYDIKHIYGTNPYHPIFTNKQVNKELPIANLSYQNIDEGIYLTGFSGGSDDFYFDNEQPRHKSYVYPFSIANRYVSNGEFLEFIKDKAYQNPLLWLSDGWDWIKENNIDRPLYWFPNYDLPNRNKLPASADIEDWSEYSLAGLAPINLSSPVCHISFYEAEAFARWTGARLPRENEWEVAAEILQSVVSESSLDKEMFLGSNYLHPIYNKHGNSPFGGGLWEWTNSYYLPYPGYRRDKGPLGEYNGKFMSGQIVMKGGSMATPISHYRHSYRNFFHPTKRWQFSGIRLAKDID